MLNKCEQHIVNMLNPYFTHMNAIRMSCMHMQCISCSWEHIQTVFPSVVLLLLLSAAFPMCFCSVAAISFMPDHYQCIYNGNNHILYVLAINPSNFDVAMAIFTLSLYLQCV